MYCDVYIGDWNDAFDSSRLVIGKPAGCPCRKSPFFPHAGQLFRQVIDMAESDDYLGGTVDWGGWVVKMTGREIADLVEEFYGDRDACLEDAIHDEMRERYRSIFAYIDDLKVGGVYGLVACEL